MAQPDIQVKREHYSAADALSGLAGGGAAGSTSSSAPAARAAVTKRGSGKAQATSQGRNNAECDARRIHDLEEDLERLRDERDTYKSLCDSHKRLLSVFGVRKRSDTEAVDNQTIEQAQQIRRLYDIASKHPNGAEEVSRRYKLFDQQVKHKYQDLVLGNLGVAPDDIVCINWNATSYGQDMFSMGSVSGNPNPEAPCELLVSLLLRPNNEINVLARCGLIEKVSPKNYDAIMDKVFDDANAKLIYNDYIQSIPIGQSKETYAAFKFSLWNDTQREIITRFPEMRARSTIAARRLMPGTGV